MNWAWRINVSSALLTLTAVLLPEGLPVWLDAARSIILVWTALGLAGLNTSLIILTYAPRLYSTASIVFLASLSVFFTAPLLLFISHWLFGLLDGRLPLIYSLLLGLLWLRLNWPERLTWSAPKLHLPTKKFWFSPLTLSVIFYAAVIGVLVSTFPTLPDADPYTWLSRTQDFFGAAEANPAAPRLFFYYFMYILSSTGHINMFIVFKYVLPFIILLALPSLALAGQRLGGKLYSVWLLAVILINPSTLLYSTTPIPQSLFTTITLISFACLLWAWQTKTQFWYGAAGFGFVLGYFYHEAAVLLLLPYLAVTLLFTWPTLRKKLTRTPLHIAGLLIVVAGLITWLKAPLLFLSYWLYRFWHSIGQAMNWQFPAAYVNIDQNQVGWPGLDGVVKYYLYYAGPPFLCLLAAVVMFWILYPAKAKLWREVRTSPALLSLLLIWATFFGIAEIAPRLFNLALLPERAWLLASTSGAFLAVALLSLTTSQTWQKRMVVITLLAAGASLGGALYINNQKTFAVAPAELQAVRWLEGLPGDRTVVAIRDPSIISYHGRTRTFVLPSDAFCSPEVWEQALITAFYPLQEKTVSYHSFLEQAIKDPNVTNMNNIIQQTQLFIDFLKADVVASRVQYLPRHLYVFFSEADKRNPYQNRPYIQLRQDASCRKPFFDHYPQQFKKIYNDSAGAQIWQVL